MYPLQTLWVLANWVSSCAIFSDSSVVFNTFVWSECCKRKVPSSRRSYIRCYSLWTRIWWYKKFGIFWTWWHTCSKSTKTTLLCSTNRHKISYSCNFLCCFLSSSMTTAASTYFAGGWQWQLAFVLMWSSKKTVIFPLVWHPYMWSNFPQNIMSLPLEKQETYLKFCFLVQQSLVARINFLQLPTKKFTISMLYLLQTCKF